VLGGSQSKKIPFDAARKEESASLTLGEEIKWFRLHKIGLSK
jgi:hypothetical protein